MGFRNGGGHGALVTALRAPDRWQSVSAFAPICNPTNVPWGQKAFPRYLGDDQAAWAEWDASVLMARGAHPSAILVDQGLADQFLGTQLKPEALDAAAATSGQKLTLRRHEGYDHSYWFIQSFIADHIAHHADTLLALFCFQSRLPTQPIPSAIWRGVRAVQPPARRRRIGRKGDAHMLAVRLDLKSIAVREAIEVLWRQRAEQRELYKTGRFTFGDGSGFRREVCVR